MKNANKQRKLVDLIPLDSPEAVLNEVLVILKLISPDFDTAPITSAYNLTIDLYEGNYPGYQSCNTGYHDLTHTIDTFLTMARILHGAVVEGEDFSQREIILGLIAAILHDSGYIQEDHDSQGTGAKHTVSHITRSMDFLEYHGKTFGLTKDEITAGRAMILCTDLSVDMASIEFPDERVEQLGKMLGTVDLLAQMADRSYLEKLLFLFHEFSEARVGDYTSEVDLLKKTVDFYDFIAKRLKETLDANDRFLISHFASRWDIAANLYQDAIDRQKQYLLEILESKSDPRQRLRRNGIVDQVRLKYGKPE